MKKTGILSVNALLAAACFSTTRQQASSFTPAASITRVSSLTTTGTSFSRRRDAHNSRGMVRLNGEKESQTTTISTEAKAASSSSSSSDWWTDYELPHAFVAKDCRSDFKILSTTLKDSNDQPLIYLDSAATSQKPDYVIDALDYYYQKQNSNVHRGAHSLSRDATAAYEGARDKIQQFVHAKSRNEIIFTSGATESINLVVSTYARTNLKAGDEVVLTEMEHHSNLVPWQMLAETTGIVLRFVKMDRTTGAVDQTEFESVLNEKTKFVAFQHVSNVAGCINPVASMVQLVRTIAAPDAKIMLDACQSVPHMPVNVQELGIDFLAASGHKMCGPTGIGFLWGREEVLNAMPPYKGGGEMIDQVTLEGSTYVPSPGRFEAGTPAIAQAVGLGAAIDYLNKIGMENIEAYEHEIADYMYKRMSEVDAVTIIGPESGTARAALCAFVVDGVHPSDLSSFLDMEGVAVRAGHHCCQPLHQSLGFSHSARASLYIYNTKEDVDNFIEKLASTISFLKNIAGKGGDGEAGDDFVPFI